MTTIGPYELDSVTCADALAFLAALPDGCADMICTDPPYGTTELPWDTVVPFEPMWTELRRIVKPRAAIVMTASQPFTSRLVMSNMEMFKYAYVWVKTRPSGFVNAKNKPLKVHEDIVVFSLGTTIHEGQSDQRMIYNPQFSSGTPYKKTHRDWNSSTMHPPSKINLEWVGHVSVSDGRRYPTTVLPFPNPNNGSNHPTQKPVALFAYLIRTYTQPGALVIDPFAGSGTTGVAARSLGRHFLLCDRESQYVEIARNRLAAPWTPPLFIEDAREEPPRASQIALFEPED